MLTGSPEIKVVPHHALEHKKWGTDNDHAEEYWFDDRIHTLGNAGLGGGLHAALAPLSTKCIDIFAYSGVDIRAQVRVHTCSIQTASDASVPNSFNASRHEQVARTLSETVGKSKAKVIDLCCGVGMSTRALRDAFPDAEKVVGIDTSPQMIAMAKFLDWHIHSFMPVLAVLSEKVSNAVTAAGNVFDHGNAEGTGQPDKHFDLVTIMYAFHEVPKQGRDRILAEAHRLLKPGGTLAVVDIACDYIPSMSMLSGEPYVIEYQKEIHNQIQRFRGFIRPRYEPVVPGHVGMWLLQRA
jgi:trans-aconitate methyltransferase